jgi:nicotinate-nucleotide adenylyltransferase
MRADKLPYPGLPPHAAGLRVGLFGGSFNPAHEGHRQASLIALRRLGLDAVWWLVTPGNPLKDNAALPSLSARLKQAAAVARHPRIKVTGVEARLGTRFTADTLTMLRRRCPAVRFVWLMGSDNLASLHRWQRWRRVMTLMPVAVIDRPGSTHQGAGSRAAIAFARARIDEADGRLLPLLAPPAWCFVHGRRSPLSSSAIRARKSEPHARNS